MYAPRFIFSIYRNVGGCYSERVWAKQVALYSMVVEVQATVAHLVARMYSLYIDNDNSKAFVVATLRARKN